MSAMTLTEAVQILRAHNEWRRRDGPPCDPPHDGKTVGLAIDLVCDVAPELLDRVVDMAGAISSINRGRGDRIKRHGEYVYGQREEWVVWMLEEILPAAQQVIVKAAP